MGSTFMPCMSNPVNKEAVFIILPAYNEQDMIRSVVEELIPLGHRVVVVDDGSAEPLTPLLTGWPVTIIRHAINLGQGAALQTGIEYALSEGAQYVVTFDADGQHRASDIPALLDPLRKGEADVCIGSRFLEGASHNMGGGRKFTLKLARLVNYLLTGMLLSDAHNGLRALNRAAAGKIRLQLNGMAHASEFLSEIKKCRLRCREVPVHIRYTAYSKAKGQPLSNSFRIFLDLILNRLAP